MNGDSHSPAPSIESDPIGTFTTSSDRSASDRIAALRAARAARRQQRESNALLGAAENASDSSFGRREPDASAVHDAAITPRLRLQLHSERSYSPTRPSTPPESISRTTTPARFALVDGDEGNGPRHVSALSARPLTLWLMGSAVTFFGRYGGRTDQAIDDSPLALVTCTSPSGAITPAPSPPSRVSVAGGPLDRLRAQRAARASTATLPPPPDRASASRVGLTNARALPTTSLDGRRLPESTVGDLPPPPTISSPARISSAVPVSEYGSDRLDYRFHQLSDVM